MYKEHAAIERAVNLHILDPYLSWTRKVADGLEKLGESVALEGEDRNDTVAIQCSTMMGKRFIAPLRKKIYDGVDEHTERRRKIDEERLKLLPSPELMRDAAQLALYDIIVLHREHAAEYKRTGKLPVIVRRALNAKAYGVLVYRSVPGRGGEWEMMELTQILKCLDDPDCWFIVVTAHKTAKSIGSLGRYMPDDIKAMLRFFVDFCKEERDQLFLPLRSATKQYQMSKLAHDYAASHTPEHQCPELLDMRDTTILISYLKNH